MSNIIPPLLSDSPPPLPPIDDDEDDDFGDYARSNDFSDDCDSPSLPPTPLYSPSKMLSIPIDKLDINSNSKTKNSTEQGTQDTHKDFQDRRKNDFFKEFNVEDSEHNESTKHTNRTINDQVVSQLVNEDACDLPQKLTDTTSDNSIKIKETHKDESSINSLVIESVENQEHNVIIQTDNTESIERKIETNKNEVVNGVNNSEFRKYNESEDKFGDFVKHDFEDVSVKQINFASTDEALESKHDSGRISPTSINSKNIIAQNKDSSEKIEFKEKNTCNSEFVNNSLSNLTIENDHNTVLDTGNQLTIDNHSYNCLSHDNDIKLESKQDSETNTDLKNIVSNNVDVGFDSEIVQSSSPKKSVEFDNGFHDFVSCDNDIVLESGKTDILQSENINSSLKQPSENDSDFDDFVSHDNNLASESCNVHFVSGDNDKVLESEKGNILLSENSDSLLKQPYESDSDFDDFVTHDNKIVSGTVDVDFVSHENDIILESDKVNSLPKHSSKEDSDFDDFVSHDNDTPLELKKDSIDFDSISNDKVLVSEKSVSSLNQRVDDEEFDDFVSHDNDTPLELKKDSIDFDSISNDKVLVSEKSVSSLNQRVDDEEFDDFVSHDNDTPLELKKDSIDFDSISNNKVLVSEKLVSSLNQSVNDEDFDDFVSHDDNIAIKTDKPESLPAQSAEIDDDFDDFADFTSAEITTVDPVNTKLSPLKGSPLQHDNQDDFDDFGDFASPSCMPETDPFQAKFSELSKIEPVETVLLNSQEALEKAQQFVKEMFPSTETEMADFKEINIEKNDFVFNELKDVTETNAIKFQWPNSASQKLLLKALNIDERNILYGPSWNPSMPRFASNLSQAPLEPVKSDILTPTQAVQKTETVSSSSSSQTTTNNSMEIPVASFDWTKAGLSDPLDYPQSLLLDLEQLVATLDIPTLNQTSLSNNSASPIHEHDVWDIWLQSISAKDANPTKPDQEDPLPSQQTTATVTKNDLEEKPIQQEVVDDFDDFTSYQAPASHQSPSWHNVVLRETYISNTESASVNVNNSTDVLRNIEGWLQPTIVTPELPRKTVEIEDNDDEFNEFQTVTTIVADHPIHISDDQLMTETPKLSVKPAEMLVPQKTTNDFTASVKSLNTKEVMGDFSEFTSFEPTKKNPSKKMSFDDFTNFKVPNVVEHKVLHRQNSKSSNSDQNVLSDVSTINQNMETLNKPTDSLSHSLPKPLTDNADDDEFTEFHSSAPNPVHTITTVLEPLKPQLVHPQISGASNKISWPDPGISEDEIKNFEVNYSRVQQKSDIKKQTDEKTKSAVPSQRRDTLVDSKKNPLNSLDKSKQPVVTKTNSLEDDEWSDFVSVKSASPIHRVANEKSRSSTPDLPLSVLNLSSLQPLKQPIPVITPQGIVHTKMSTNSNTNMLNMQSVVQNNHVLPQPQNSYCHPSIISTQFANQAFNNFNGIKSPNNQKSMDDDEWSDFVSHQSFSKPVSSGNSSQKTNWQPQNMSNWASSATPNIITNPGSFDMLRVGNSDMLKNKQPVKKAHVPGTSTASKKGAMSMPLPDLDFIAPKSRTSMRK